MKRAWVRSSLFNVLFLLWTAVLCILYLPSIVFPRSVFMSLVQIYLRGIWVLERVVLNLRLKIRGQEHLPKDGSYIIAAKHQSTYETLKLHLVFRDPAVILKQELLRIPFWGQYLAKADVIAIDRSSPDLAIQSIQDGARRVKEQGRPIVIFPQGTRVRPDQTAADKSYKVGIARIQEATDLPIIPMAINSGMFWPRTGWGKSSGTVVFEFLPPIAPGMERSKLISKLTQVVEEKSNTLMDEARSSASRRSNFLVKMGIVALVLFGLYSVAWFGVKQFAHDAYLDLPAPYLHDYKRTIEHSAVSGFPFSFQFDSTKDELQTSVGSLMIDALHLDTTALPLPFNPVHIKAEGLSIQDVQWAEKLAFEVVEANATYNLGDIHIENGVFKHARFAGSFEGRINPHIDPPAIDMVLRVKNHLALVDLLVERGFIRKRMKVWIVAGLGALMKGDFVEIPIRQKQGMLYAASFPIYNLAQEQPKQNDYSQPIRRRPLLPDPRDP